MPLPTAGCCLYRRALALCARSTDLGKRDFALDFHHRGHGLTGDGIYKLVRRYCTRVGISKRMSPHRVQQALLDYSGVGCHRRQRAEGAEVIAASATGHPDDLR